MDPANIMSNFANTVMTCLWFSPVIPLAIPLAAIFTFLDYWINKRMLLRKYKRPNMFGGLMATFFANLLPYVILIWACGTAYFYISLEVKMKEYFKDAIAKFKKEKGSEFKGDRRYPG